MVKNDFRDRQVGDINFVYQGDKHVGNILAPKTFTAVSKLWGKKTTHVSKAAAMAWLKKSHGVAAMKVESADNDSIHDVLRQHGWKKATPYGFKYHVMANDRIRYVHPDVPGHHIVASYHDKSWQHHTRADSDSAHVSYGAIKLHAHLQRLHGTKSEETIRNFVQYFRENEPEDWRNVVLDIVGGKLVINDEKITEGPEQSIQGSTPHSTMQRAVKASKLSIIKKKPTNLLGNPKPNSVSEEIFDWEKNQKDPKAGPNQKKN